MGFQTLLIKIEYPNISLSFCIWKDNTVQNVHRLQLGKFYNSCSYKFINIVGTWFQHTLYKVIIQELIRLLFFSWYLLSMTMTTIYFIWKEIL
jgi:hypothetical protein